MRHKVRKKEGKFVVGIKHVASAWEKWWRWWCTLSRTICSKSVVWEIWMGSDGRENRERSKKDEKFNWEQKI